MAVDPEHHGADCGLVENDAHEFDEAQRCGPLAVGFRRSQLIERHEIAGRDRLLDFSEKMSLQSGVYLPIESVRWRRRNSHHQPYPDVRRIVFLLEVAYADAADVSGDSCASARPAGPVEHAVVNQTDQIIQAFAIAVIVRRGGQFRNRL